MSTAEERINQFSNGVLHGLQGKQMYEGTVDPGTKHLRRETARRARKARKINRRKGNR